MFGEITERDQMPRLSFLTEGAPECRVLLMEDPVEKPCLNFKMHLRFSSSSSHEG